MHDNSAVAIAEAAPCAYAGFSNADIMVSPAAIARVVRGQRDAVIFSRMDIDPVTGAVAVVSEGQLLVEPVGLALEASTGAIVVASRTGIVSVHPITGAQTLISSGGSLVFPSGVAIVP